MMMENMDAIHVFSTCWRIDGSLEEDLEELQITDRMPEMMTEKFLKSKIWT